MEMRGDLRTWPSSVTGGGATMRPGGRTGEGGMGGGTCGAVMVRKSTRAAELVMLKP